VTLYVQAELPSACRGQADKVASLLQTPAQQDQPCFEVVFDIGQLQAGIQADFLVRKVDPAALGVALDEFPKDATGNSLDQIPVIDKNAVVRLIMLDRCGGRGLHSLLGSRHFLKFGGLAALQQSHRRRHLTRDDSHHTFIV